MRTTVRKHVLSVAALVITLTLSLDGLADPSKPKVSVNNITELYAAVNAPQNENKVLVIAPGTYLLDSLGRPNGGRLELQSNMSLQGAAGDPEAVVIDASALPTTSYQIPSNQISPVTFLTGAVRMGRGSNNIEWLTIRNAVNGTAAIETDLDSMSASVRIAHVIVHGNQRGIDVRNLGESQAGRVLDARLESNITRDNMTGEGMGLRFINTNGANNAIVHAVLIGNESSGNFTGCVAHTLNSSLSQVIVDSTNDDFSDNGQGCILSGGTSQGPLAEDNVTIFTSHGSEFTDNVGPVFDSLPLGGIVAIGGWNGSVPARANRNAIQVGLWASSVEDNRFADMHAFGGLAGTAGVAAGTGNQLLIELHGFSKPIVPVVDTNSLTGNTVRIQ